SFVKSIMKKGGRLWRNNLSFYIAGLHDFYQHPSDIYYKFLIRSKRSSSDLRKLQSIFKAAPLNADFQIAQQGLDDGNTLEVVFNNKYLYTNGPKIEKHQSKENINSFFIDILILKRLIQHYKLNY